MFIVLCILKFKMMYEIKCLMFLSLGFYEINIFEMDVLI